MKYVELKKYIAENGISPIYLFEGEEIYFLKHGEKMLLDIIKPERTLDYSSFDGSTLKGDKLKSFVGAVMSFPFMSEKRVVKVSEFYPTEKEYDTYLKPVFETPNENCVLIIENESKSKVGAVKLSSKENVTAIDCAKSDEETIIKWIYLTLKRAGISADGSVCEKIETYLIGDMARIETETEKLIAYCTATGNNVLTDETVDDIVYPDSEYKIYELANAISRKNYSAFVKISKDLSAKGFDEISLLSSLSFYFKGLYETALSRGTDKDVAKNLGLKEYGVKKNRELVQKLGKENIYVLYSGLYGIISDVKSGVLPPSSAWKLATTKLFFE